MPEVQLNIPDLEIRVKGLIGLGVTGAWIGGSVVEVNPDGPLTITAELELFNPNQVEVVINPGAQVSVVDAGADGIFENYEFDKDAQGSYLPWTIPPAIGDLNGAFKPKVYITLSLARKHNDVAIVRLSGIGSHA